MARIAFGCIEEQADGRWVCQKTTTFAGRFGPIDIQAGQSFSSPTAFGGFDDFTAFLMRSSVEAPRKSPHEW